MLILSLSGCVVYHQPPRLNKEESKAIQESPYFNLSVGVRMAPDPDNIQQYYNHRNEDPHDLAFVKLLRETNLFRSVDLLPFEKDQPDLIFELKPGGRRFLCGNPNMLGIFTIGIVPLVNTDWIYYSYTVSLPDSKPVEVPTFQYHRGDLQGWLVSIWAPYSNWTYSKESQRQRNLDQLKYQLVSLKPQIDSLRSA